MNMNREGIEYLASLPLSRRKTAIDIIGFFQEKEKERRKFERERERE